MWFVEAEKLHFAAQKGLLQHASSLLRQPKHLKSLSAVLPMPSKGRDDACTCAGHGSPLYLAAEKGHDQMVSLLCNAKADVDALKHSNDNGCKRTRDVEMVELPALLQGITVARCSSSWPPQCSSGPLGELISASAII